jgi:hypothetical protein
LIGRISRNDDEEVHQCCDYEDEYADQQQADISQANGAAPGTVRA